MRFSYVSRKQILILNHLDLFSGIGGFALASKWIGGIKTIGFCENEKYSQKVLKNNFKEIPIFDDVRKLHPDVIIPRDGRIDFITAGFPCQDLSIAGNQAGIEADRSGLFFQITRLSDEIHAYCGTRPALVLENVSNILSGDRGNWARIVYRELAVRGYCVEWKTLGASHVGAPHRRLRWWAVCYMANTQGQLSNGFKDHPEGCMGSESISESGNRGWKENLANPLSRRCKKRKSEGKQIPHIGFSGQGTRGIRESKLRLGGISDGIPDWMDEPGDIPRVTKGQKDRVSRLKGLGNAVVPQCAMIPLMRIKEILLSAQ